MPKGKSINRAARSARLRKECREAIHATLAEYNSSKEWLGKSRILKSAIVRMGGSVKSNPGALWSSEFELLLDEEKVTYCDDLGYRWGDMTIISTDNHRASMSERNGSNNDAVVPNEKRRRKPKLDAHEKVVGNILVPEFLRTLGEGYLALANAFEESMREVSEKIDALANEVAALRASSELSLRGEVDRVYQEVVYAIGQVSGKK